MYVAVGECFDNRRLPRARESDDHYKLDRISVALSVLAWPSELGGMLLTPWLLAVLLLPCPFYRRNSSPD